MKKGELWDYDEVSNMFRLSSFLKNFVIFI